MDRYPPPYLDGQTSPGCWLRWMYAGPRLQALWLEPTALCVAIIEQRNDSFVATPLLTRGLSWAENGTTAESLDKTKSSIEAVVLDALRNVKVAR